MNPADLTELGRVLRPHGLKGALKLRVTAKGTPVIEHEEPVFILMQGGPVPFFPEEKPAMIGDTIVLKLEGIDTVEQAEAMSGRQVLIDPAMLEPDEGEELDALVGMRVVDVNLSEIGTVTGIMEIPQQSVLEVQHGEKQILIPAVEGIIVGIDTDAREITVETPPGLVDLYLNG